MHLLRTQWIDGVIGWNSKILWKMSSLPRWIRCSTSIRTAADASSADVTSRFSRSIICRRIMCRRRKARFLRACRPCRSNMRSRSSSRLPRPSRRSARIRAIRNASKKAKAPEENGFPPGAFFVARYFLWFLMKCSMRVSASAILSMDVA